MKAIVAVDAKWGIGCRGNLLQWIPEDMNFFRKMTLGKIVIMGRTTYESLPGKAPLRDRINIVLSADTHFKNEKVTICRSLDELFRELKKYKRDDVFIIGGESVYTQLLPSCKEAYVTKIESEYPADKHFTNLANEAGWELVSASELKNFNSIEYRFLKYENQAIKYSDN